MADQSVPYSKVFQSGYSVTGIRSLNADNSQVLITGSCPTSDPRNTMAMLYSGPKNPSDSSQCQCIDMSTPLGVSVQSSVFYGPNTPFFTPTIGGQYIRAVGSYRCNQETYDHGVLYTGPLDGSGTDWVKIDMPDEVADPTGARSVRNTIPHSTMGDLVVGCYDLEGDAPGKFNAFIYKINPENPVLPDNYRQVRLPPYQFITAYGIWQNGEDKYTIVGGLDNGDGVNVGYMVDYDSGTFNNLTLFPYQQENFLTHFEGITDVGKGTTEFGPKYYSLAATGDQTVENLKDGGAAFVVVERVLPGGILNVVNWQPFQVGGSLTTGNTVLANNLYGVYGLGNHQFQSYLASNFPVVGVNDEG